MTGRAYEFVDLYKQLEDELEKRIPAHEKGYASVVIQFSNSDAGLPYRDRLNLCREVRNLISHNADMDGEPPIEPSQALLDSLRDILRAVRAEPAAMTRATPAGALLSAGLRDRAVPLMRRMSQQGFSHVPVMDGGIMRGIFSVGTIFAAGLQGRRFTLSADTRLEEFEDLLAPDRHLTERFLFAPEGALLCDVRALFSLDPVDHHTRRVAAVFLTRDGTQHSALRGMLTPWDIIKPL